MHMGELSTREREAFPMVVRNTLRAEERELRWRRTNALILALAGLAGTFVGNNLSAAGCLIHHC